MKDFVPNGTGNSRFLKSVSNFLQQYPSYADFNGVNSAGYSQLGTPLSKANLLSDATAARINTVAGSTPGTVNEAFSEIATAFPPCVGEAKIGLLDASE